MLVASNTSPICNLIMIGRLDLLRARFDEILIPGAVTTELDRLSHPDASRAIQEALRAEWIKVQKTGEDKVARLLKTTLDPGEAAAIGLALEISADLILLESNAVP
jgi:predicted nucleic acid-binding protein